MKTIAIALLLIVSAVTATAAPQSTPARASSSQDSSSQASQQRISEAINEALYALNIADRSARLAQQDNEPLKVCHSLGVLHYSMVFLANNVLNGSANPKQRTAINGIMPAMAELNAYCRVPSNLAAWKPKVEVRTTQDITTRLAHIQLVVSQMR